MSGRRDAQRLRRVGPYKGEIAGAAWVRCFVNMAGRD